MVVTQLNHIFPWNPRSLSQPGSMLPKLTSCSVCPISSLFLNLAICEGSVANETLIGTEFFLAAPGEAQRLVFLWEEIFFSSDLFVVLRELWPLLGPYALLQVL